MKKITFRVTLILGQSFFVPELKTEEDASIIAFNKIEADWFFYCSPGTIFHPDDVKPQYWIVSLLKEDTVMDTACIRRYPGSYSFQWNRGQKGGGEYAENFSEGQTIQVQLPENTSPEDFIKGLCSGMSLGETKENWRRFNPTGYTLYIKGVEAKMFNKNAISGDAFAKLEEAIKLVFSNPLANFEPAINLVGKRAAIALVACKIMTLGDESSMVEKPLEIEKVKHFLWRFRLLFNSLEGQTVE